MNDYNAAPCPFCKSDDIGTLTLDEGEIRMRCRKCGGHGPATQVAGRYMHLPHTDEQAVRRAVELWNTRP